MSDAELLKIADHLVANQSSDQGDAIDQTFAVLKDLRERCANIAESMDTPHHMYTRACVDIAAKIRNGE